jgi:hypothetical protein
MRGALEFDTKAQVSHMKLCYELRLELGYSLFVVPCDK